MEAFKTAIYWKIVRCSFKSFKQYTGGDPEIRGKVLFNRIAFIDLNENLQT